MKASTIMIIGMIITFGSIIVLAITENQINSLIIRGIGILIMIYAIYKLEKE